MIPRTPLPDVSFPEVMDPLEFEPTAIHWLMLHGYTLEQAQHVQERVELVYATADDDDAFWFGSRMYRVLNPLDFGVSPWRDTAPITHDAEPWLMAPPDVEPQETDAATLRTREQARLMQNAYRGAAEPAPEPHVVPASRAERCCTWCVCIGGCIALWGVLGACVIARWGHA